MGGGFAGSSSICRLGAFLIGSRQSPFFSGCMEDVGGGDGEGEGRKAGSMKGEKKVSGGRSETVVVGRARKAEVTVGEAEDECILFPRSRFFAPFSVASAAVAALRSA